MFAVLVSVFALPLLVLVGGVLVLFVLAAVLVFLPLVFATTTAATAYATANATRLFGLPFLSLLSVSLRLLASQHRMSTRAHNCHMSIVY